MGLRECGATAWSVRGLFELFRSDEQRSVMRAFAEDAPVFIHRLGETCEVDLMAAEEAAATEGIDRAMELIRDALLGPMPTKAQEGDG